MLEPCSHQPCFHVAGNDQTTYTELWSEAPAAALHAEGRHQRGRAAPLAKKV